MFKKFWFLKSFRLAKVADILMISRRNHSGISIEFSHCKGSWYCKYLGEIILAILFYLKIYLVKDHNHCCLIKFVSFKHNYRLLNFLCLDKFWKCFLLWNIFFFRKRKKLDLNICWFYSVKYLLFLEKRKKLG